jgi:hypothetical protein
VAPPQLAAASPRLLARATLRRRNLSSDPARVAVIGDGRSLVPLMRRLDAHLNADMARRWSIRWQCSVRAFGAQEISGL